MLRKTLIGLAASLALAAGSSSALAQGTAITYQGRLQNSGALVNTPTDMQFSLWNDPVLSAPANQVGSTITQTNVTVNNGLFTTGLEFGVNPYTSSQNLYLQIAVRNPAGGVAPYVPMGSRQLLTPAPFSLATRGINVLSNGEVRTASNFAIPAGTGIFTHGGAMNNGGRLHIQSGDDGTFDGLYLNPFPNGGNVYVGNGAGVADLICSDRVGIGMTTPPAKLSIASTLQLQSWHDGAGTRKWNLNLNAFAGGPGLYFSESGVNASNLVLREGGRVGINTESPDQTLTVNGNASKPGGGSWAVFSDPRLKHDIQPLQGTLDRLLQLRGYSFEYNEDVVADGRCLPGTQVGLMADDVEAVFPDWVSVDSNGLRMVTERATTALMVEALRELRAEKDAEAAELQADNAELKARLEKIEAFLAAQAANAAK